MGTKFPAGLHCVNRAGDDLLAHTRFSEQKRRRSGASYFFDKLTDLTDRLRLTHEAVGAVHRGRLAHC